MKTTIKLLTLTAALSFIAGCVAPSESGPAEPSTTQVQYRLPVVSPVEPDKQIQEKDGIRVSVAPYRFGTRDVAQHEYRRKMALFIANNQWPVDIKTTSSVQVYPNNVVFKVKINNQLERVLRLAGTVVAFQVGGKQMAVDKSAYQDFQNGIILPRQEGEFNISGPSISGVPDNATIALFLYDIVTETDAAGNATKRSNFEFIYTLSRQSQFKELPTGIKSGYVTEQAANLLMARERQQGLSPGDWIKAPELDNNAGVRSY